MDRERQCLLSVIVPVYNGEKHIQVCLDSLLNQDIDSKLYEIICINDGSTDDSLSILRDYEQRFENLRVVDKPNGGVSAARNLGMELATGTYVWLIDADDWVARNCLGLIVEQLQMHMPSVLQVHFDYIKAQWRIDECKAKLLDTQNVTVHVQGPVSMDISGAWSSVFKKSLLSRYDHRFIENLHYGEDILFVQDVFDRMRIEQESGNDDHKVIHCKGDIFYYYRMHDDSAMQKSWTTNRDKYMNAMLQWMKIDRARMMDKTKPLWYREQYERLFYERAYNYMMNWLPGGTKDLKEQLKCLKEEKLYPCPRAPKELRKEWLKAEGLTGKVKSAYKYAAFRHKWVYPIYYKQMAQKYESAKNNGA